METKTCKCVFCGGEMHWKTDLVYTEKINGQLIIIKDIPGYECEECFENVFSAEVSKNIFNAVDYIISKHKADKEKSRIIDAGKLSEVAA